MSKSPLIKQHWIERCVNIHNFHVSQFNVERGWTVEKTARALNRSIGSVCQDLLIASWLKTHEKQLRRFTCAKDALEYIRSKKREMKSQELSL